MADIPIVNKRPVGSASTLPPDLRDLLARFLKDLPHVTDENSIREIGPGLHISPGYGGEMDKIAEIWQNEYGITTSNDPHPVLATSAPVNCVSVVGYEKEKGVAFVTHYQHGTDLDSAFGMLLYNLRRATRGEDSVFYVRIVGGDRGMSPELWDEVRRELRSSIGMEIKFEIIDEVTDGRGGFDGVIDARSGTFYDKYDPLAIPQRRPDYPPGIQEMIFQMKTPTLAYFPSDIS